MGLGVVLSQLYCSPLVFFFVPGQLPLQGSAPLQGGLACLFPVCWSTLWCGWWGLAATFSSVPVRCFPCCRYIGFSGLLLLRLLAGVVVALHPVSGYSSCGVVCLVCSWVPLLPFPYLRWVYFWLRCLQSLWATKAVSAALRGSSSSSGVCWSISFFWSWGGVWSRVGGSSCDSWFWSLLMLGHTFLTPSPLPLLPSMAVGWSWCLVFLVLCLGSVFLASRVGC